MNKKIIPRKLGCIWWGIFGSGHIQVSSCCIDPRMIRGNKWVICLEINEGVVYYGARLILE